MDPEEENEEEAVAEAVDGDSSGALGNCDALFFPDNFNDFAHKKVFAAPDTGKLVTMALLVSRLSHRQRLHSMLAIDHVTDGQELTLSEGGISSLTQHLLENPTLQLMGVCISKHRTEALVTASDVQLLLRVCGLADDYKLVLVITWKTGKEPRAGYKAFHLRRDRLGMALCPRTHEPADFLLQSTIVQEKIQISVAVKGAPLKVDKKPAADPSKVAAPQLRAPSLKLARATDLLNFLGRESQARGSRTLPVADWLDRAPTPAGVTTIEQTKIHIRESLEQLCQAGRLQIQRSPGNRWKFESWTCILPS
jgi:hypothetical protein